LIPIVTDIPGNREWIEDQNNGFLFPTSSHETLAEKIIHVTNEFSRWTEFRRKNEAVIRNRAAWEDNMRSIEDRFQTLVSGD
jgi:glycosyltransferase involved in cell wall biosynthesis